MLKKNNKRKIFCSALVLGSFGFLAASFVSIIYVITKNKIQYQEQRYKNIIFNHIVPSNLHDNDIQRSCLILNNKLLGDKKNHYLWLAKKKQDITAVIFETIAPDGYSGIIKMVISLDIKNGKILGVRVLSHNETPGLGDKIDVNISNWITKFSGVKIFSLDERDLSLKKYGGNIDQFTGATITPLAVVNSIKRTIVLVKMLLSSKFSELTSCDNYE
ncbi:electron transport complex protein RnfG [Buchnera aphidicola str. Bp (Baizongia pistaciae)]|uniref:Ion-translocating oxidoreductase complex subunit G n=1 Tax=Buchnera aphidicola subsp. Baizongia pistaciae (strain Bp) TaxID=224915 RepID=RNFG_BUCBP|nr:electron transport complex subunit RsxG [Buchnera aphidicola]Q89AW6.1 RecName: Full=Ion-translocating oxidoreductase complex subunit G; AltName: Full=Rnf electron transport complex subunit G [Buchnera aphidicola str. Bp (Baizongia pistaciae)]AAO26846.1 electron transport complex protein RnfG [Buchnera aphidicola str. Bp (Baizongia pistaciae)]